MPLFRALVKNMVARYAHQKLPLFAKCGLCMVSTLCSGALVVQVAYQVGQPLLHIFKLEIYNKQNT
jgi:hypothetical protein